MNELDEKLIVAFTPENFVEKFNSLLQSKTDRYNHKVKLPMGVDGVDYETIRNDLPNVARCFARKCADGKHILHPFKEIEIPKAPYTKNEFTQAKRAGKLRPIAICSIRDTIFQKIVYDAVYDYTNTKYAHLDKNIFAYRKKKSVRLAINEIQNIIKQGYIYGLDGDIRKFFDMINHDKLIQKLKDFYGDNPLLHKYLRRFIKVKRVLVEPNQNWNGYDKYYNVKPDAIRRIQGIPQGGVLSGLLANLFLYDFDNFVIQNVGSHFDIKYVRYADDFLVLCKSPDEVIKIYASLRKFLTREKLTLHPINMYAISGKRPTNLSKTKAINLAKENFIEFLGYRIMYENGRTRLGIKSDNIEKFKKRIKHEIDMALARQDMLEDLIFKINAKILGNQSYGQGFFTPCKFCGKPQKPQSWIGYFCGITDFRPLKALDVWIRTQLYEFYLKRFGTHLSKDRFRYEVITQQNQNLRFNLQSLFKSVIIMKNWYKNSHDAELCDCDFYVPDLETMWS